MACNRLGVLGGVCCSCFVKRLYSGPGRVHSVRVNMSSSRPSAHSKRVHTAENQGAAKSLIHDLTVLCSLTVLRGRKTVTNKQQAKQPGLSLR